MSVFAAVLARTDGDWSATEISIDDCESIDDLADATRDVPGDVRLLVVEQDDEYAVLARVDDDEIAVFLSDGHAADAYVLAAFVAEELEEIGGDQLGEDILEGDDPPPAHDSAPFGDPAVAEDLGTPAPMLLDLCARLGVLPIDLIAAVAERAGAAEAFESVRA